MDEFLADCAMLTQLTAALHTALNADDVHTFMAIVQGRGALLEACLEHYMALDPAGRQMGRPKLEAILVQDDAILAEGATWLAQIRVRLTQLGQTTAMLAQYRKPLDLLPTWGRLDVQH